MEPKSKTLTDYERQRLENIRRNHEMMSSLMIQRKAADLSAALKPKRTQNNPKIEPKAKTPIVLRRSLRTRGIPASSSAVAATTADSDAVPPPSYLPRKRGLLLIRDAFVATGPRDSDSALIDAIAGSSAGSDPGPAKEAGFDPRSELVLRPDNVAKVVSERILSVRFLPFEDREVVAVGNKIGILGFWDVNFSNSEGYDDGIYLYRPHSAPVSGISVHPFSPRKIYTCSYDGFIRLMDVEKETFNMIIYSDYYFYSICQWPHDANSLYIAEGIGMLKAWDERGGKDSSFWNLHEANINTIDFHPGNAHLMATSSTDGLVCIWDLRSMKKDGLESVKRISHERSVQSAYFSPTGKYLGTTSRGIRNCLEGNHLIDGSVCIWDLRSMKKDGSEIVERISHESLDKVGIASGANFDDMSMVSHNNGNGRWESTFRAIWGWDDSYMLIGNTKRAIDVLSTSNKRTASLESPYITSIPGQFAAHPYMLGHLAGTSSSGTVFVWTKE